MKTEYYIDRDEDDPYFSEDIGEGMEYIKVYFDSMDALNSLPIVLLPSIRDDLNMFILNNEIDDFEGFADIANVMEIDDNLEYLDNSTRFDIVLRTDPKKIIKGSVKKHRRDLPVTFTYNKKEETFVHDFDESFRIIRDSSKSDNKIIVDNADSLPYDFIDINGYYYIPIAITDWMQKNSGKIKGIRHVTIDTESLNHYYSNSSFIFSLTDNPDKTFVYIYDATIPGVYIDKINLKQYTLKNLLPYQEDDINKIDSIEHFKKVLFCKLQNHFPDITDFDIIETTDATKPEYTVYVEDTEQQENVITCRYIPSNKSWKFNYDLYDDMYPVHNYMEMPADMAEERPLTYEELFKD